MPDEQNSEEGLMISGQSDKGEANSHDGPSTRKSFETPMEGELVADEALEEYRYRNLAGTSGEPIEGEISERSLQPATEPPHSQDQFTERNEHWEGVIHYQDTRHGADGHELPPEPSSPSSSQWEGIQQTRTDSVDVEGERLSSQVQRESSDRSQELALSHEHSLER